MGRKQQPEAYFHDALGVTGTQHAAGSAFRVRFAPCYNALRAVVDQLEWNRRRYPRDHRREFRCGTTLSTGSGISVAWSFVMHDEELHLLDQLEDEHWWFVGKRQILRAVLSPYSLGKRFLDLGCGTGGVLRDWTTQSYCVGLDRSAVALQHCHERGLTALAQGDVLKLPFRRSSFDTVVMMDVLEHLEDDVAFLREASDVCVPNGHMVISVPAFQLLWSQHDETFMHYRRYTASGLQRVIREAGLDVERITYTNSLLFPLAAAWRILSYRLGLGRLAPKTDHWQVPGWLNRLLIAVYRLEARMLRQFKLPLGVSVMCVARKPAA